MEPKIWNEFHFFVSHNAPALRSWFYHPVHFTPTCSSASEFDTFIFFNIITVASPFHPPRGGEGAIAVAD